MNVKLVERRNCFVFNSHVSSNINELFYHSLYENYCFMQMHHEYFELILFERLEGIENRKSICHMKMNGNPIK